MITAATGNVLMARSADGTPIACWRSGAGPPLVLVHGSGEDHGRWARIASRLEQRFTVHAIDRRGRGASGDAEAYSLGAEGGDIAAVVDQIGGGVVVGHSYGAVCALEAATRTTRIDALVLFEPPVSLPGQDPPADRGEQRAIARRVRRLVADGKREQALATFLVEVVGLSPGAAHLLRDLPGFAHTARFAHTLAREIEAAQQHVFEPGRLRRPQTPILLLVGGASPLPLRAGAARLEAALAHARVEVLEGQSHAALDMRPRLIVDALVRFVDEQAA